MLLVCASMHAYGYSCMYVFEYVLLLTDCPPLLCLTQALRCLTTACPSGRVCDKIHAVLGCSEADASKSLLHLEARSVVLIALLVCVHDDLAVVVVRDDVKISPRQKLRL